MKLGLMILLNALLVSFFLYWLRREYRRAGPGLRPWLLPALAWRLLLTAISNNYPGPDARLLLQKSRYFVDDFWAQPAAAFTLWQSNHFQAAGEIISFYTWSNTLYFLKLLALLNLAAGGSGWLAGLYLSLACFAACWVLVRGLGQVFPLASLAAAGIAFLAWPTVIWWTSGLTKETLLLGAGAGVVALALPAIYGVPSGEPLRLGRRLGQLAVGLLLVWVMVRIRLFFALPLLGGLLALALVRLATRRGWLGAGWQAQVGGLLVLLVLGTGPALIGGNKVLSIKFLMDEVGRNYQHGLRTSPGRPHLEYADWQPTPLGLLRHAPLAAEQVLTRPWLGESSQLLYVGAGLENLLLLGLLGLALVAVWRGRAGRLPAALVALLIIYCLLLAAFIGLSTPNLGTLSRYRTALLPWLLLLLLQNDYARRLLKRVGQWVGVA
ncbi:hypothetical protein GKZ68_05105 [Hymenobacter sp. BRD128]|uniref:hypothetical protein n=1 Tax=Hymenobacter sp. BRD128 TaxID=2675878 RepID=UPI001564013C|nr:hypothetical protein [Hymenobacter sp. BRD128]QKG56070.1 hypothetical protein GKZ68_05105 [Hymenobacter sp. BRD128]